MRHQLRSRAAWTGILLTAAMAGCDTGGMIRDGLVTADPGWHDGPVGSPPVTPDALTIEPTLQPPTATPTVAPQPILPRMDKDFRVRQFPAGAGPTIPPATQAADLETVPYGQSTMGSSTTRPATQSIGSQP